MIDAEGGVKIAFSTSTTVVLSSTPMISSADNGW
jgi:hypothetical protein